MATATLTIDRTDMSLSALVFSGANGTAFGLMDLSEPVMIPRTEYASGGRYIDGAVAVASTWDLTAIAAVVELKYTTASALQDSYDALVAALARISFTVTITKNSDAVSYKTQGRCGIGPAKNLDRLDLTRTTQLYNLTFPIHPVPVA